MRREIPIITLRALQQEASDDATILFVSIRHPALDGVIRLVGDGEDFVLDGQTFHKGGFELSLLTDEESPPTASFSFPNVKRDLMARMETVTDPAGIQFEAYSSAYFDTNKVPRTAKAGMVPQPFYQARHLWLTDVEVNAERVSGTLRSRDYRQETWPGRRATPELTPGVWPQ